MAGTDPSGGFQSATFRTDIEFAMQMGQVNEIQNAPTFRWLVNPSFSPNPTDPTGWPWSLNAPINPAGPAQISDLQVLCAVQFGSDAEEGTVAGVEEAVRAQITLLDSQQKLLIAHGGRMPDQVLLAGAIYNMNYILQQALFDVDVYILYATAVDQT
jgi:hypothetical protein